MVLWLGAPLLLQDLDNNPEGQHLAWFIVPVFP